MADIIYYLSYDPTDYIPYLIAGIMSLIVGVIIVNFIMKRFERGFKKYDLPVFDLTVFFFKSVCYLVVVVISLSFFKIDTTVITTFFTPIIWGLSIGLGAGVGISFGWGSKDIIAEYMKKKL